MLKLFTNFTKKELLLIVICVLLVFLQVHLELRIPDYMNGITTLIQTSGTTVNEILGEGVKMLICALGSMITAVFAGLISAYVSAMFSRNLRLKLYEKVESFGMEEIKGFKTSSLITRTTNDITQVTMLISMGLQMFLRAPIMASLAITKILDKSVEWTYLTVAGVLILLIMIIAMILIVLPKFKIMQKLVDKINDLTRENLTGIRVVRAFNAEKYQEEKFDKGNDELTETSLFTQKVMSLASPIMMMIMHSMTLGIYVIGAYLIEGAALGDKIGLFSDMVVFSSYSMQVIMSFLMLAVLFIMVPRVQVSAIRINEVLDKDPKVKSGNYNKNTKEKGLVEFKNVSFKYPDGDEEVLENISFKVKKGETLAIIGRTGSGKSSVINLIPRFYDVTSGEVLIDNINVKDYSLPALYKKLGYVPQKAVMFSGTIKSNIKYGNDTKNITDEDIDKALKVGQAYDFVNRKEDGVNSHIARGGTNVSGGQKQRLAISRAIAKNPEIYIFDDSFSALDYKTDFKLRTELKKHTKDATVIIVAQRIGTIMNADQIIVLDEGKCVGSGTHKELLKNCPIYKDIAYSQLSKEELEDE